MLPDYVSDRDLLELLFACYAVLSIVVIVAVWRSSDLRPWATRVRILEEAVSAESDAVDRLTRTNERLSKEPPSSVALASELRRVTASFASTLQDERARTAAVERDLFTALRWCEAVRLVSDESRGEMERTYVGKNAGKAPFGWVRLLDVGSSRPNVGRPLDSFFGRSWRNLTVEEAHELLGIAKDDR